MFDLLIRPLSLLKLTDPPGFFKPEDKQQEQSRCSKHVTSKFDTTSKEKLTVEFRVANLGVQIKLVAKGSAETTSLFCS